jgi:hypothetical protein
MHRASPSGGKRTRLQTAADSSKDYNKLLIAAEFAFASAAEV